MKTKNHVKDQLSKTAKYEQRIKSLNDLLEKEPNNAGFLMLKGLYLGIIGKDDEALKVFDRALQLDPYNAMIYHSKAMSLLKTHKYDEALKVSERASELDPQNALILQGNGLALILLGRNEMALDILDKALKINSEYFEVLNLKAKLLMNMKRYSDAFEVLNKAIALKSDDDELWFNKSFILSEFETYEESLQAVNKAIEINSKEGIYWEFKAFILCVLLRNEQALEAIRVALDIMPKNAHTWHIKGIILNDLKRIQDALVSLFRSIEINPEKNLAYIDIAEIYFDYGDINSSSAYLEKISEIIEGSASALLLSAKIDVEEKRYKIAVQTIKKAISLEINNHNLLLWEAYVNYLYAESNIGRKDFGYREEISSIIRSLERININMPNDKKHVKVYVLYFLGCFYFKINDFYSALEKLEECINLKTKIGVENKAGYLLSSIWNYKIKPRWWRWWLFSPCYKWTKRFIFTIVSLLLLIMLLLPTFWNLFSLFISPMNAYSIYSRPSFWSSLFSSSIDIETIPYVFIITCLTFILLSPNIEKIKIKDIEVELPAPISSEIFPTVVFETSLKEMNKMDELMLATQYKIEHDASSGAVLR